MCYIHNSYPSLALFFILISVTDVFIVRGQI